MLDKLKFVLNRLQERLWVKPLIIYILSILAVFLARLADNIEPDISVPEISASSIDALLSILSSGMLVISTFAVASMIASYTSASSSATPRSFPLIISDDVSQNALSVFIGAFIFSIVSTIMFENSYFGKAGTFVLFLMILFVFILVVVIFVRWVDSIARLGRMGSTIEKIEQATYQAMTKYKKQPAFGGKAIESVDQDGFAVYSDNVGYVQHLEMDALQKIAEQEKVIIQVTAMPGSFTTADYPLAYIAGLSYQSSETALRAIRAAYIIGKERKFDHDPRFGLIALSEIAGRALSPGINDPGTAISIIGSLVRLFSYWAKESEQVIQPLKYDRVELRTFTTQDMFDDAFNMVSRDGAGIIEVAIRLQKAFKSLACLGDQQMTDAARRHSAYALQRSMDSLDYPQERASLTEITDWFEDSSPGQNQQA